LRTIKARLSYANIIATVALFVALGGTVYASNKINGKQIKPNSIPGNRIKDGTLTGQKIKAATLGPVPAASNADTLDGLPPSAFLPASGIRADGAASAQHISGFKSINFTDILSKSFTVPSAGFAYLTASVTSEADGKAGILCIRLTLDGTPLVKENSQAHRITTGGELSDTDFVGSTSIMIVAPVSAGAHIVAIQAREEGAGAGNADFIQGREVSALFFPNGTAPTIPLPGS
jgi:hypothetical protein